MSYSVGEVSRRANLTVRTLHHYDDIGLVHPSARSESGYRLYNDADLTRLAQVLFYRELGLPLEDIGVILDDPTADATAHLQRQETLLHAQIERIQAMAAAVKHALEAIERNQPVSPEDLLEVFGWDSSSFLARRQGEGESGTLSAQDNRPMAMTRADWEEVVAHNADFARRLVDAFEAGVGADSPQAMDLAEEHLQDFRRQIDCTYEIHTRICQGYVDDPETFTFAIGLSEERPGVAAFLRDAAQANTARATSS